MKHKRIWGVAALILGATGILMSNGCEEITEISEGVCGPCGVVAKGDATITGNAELDGIFKAIGTLKMTTGAIQANFDARVRALAEGVFDIQVEGKTTQQLVDEIKAAYELQIKGQMEGGIAIKYEPPKCEASVDVAVQAQAQCEAKVDASCQAEIECDPGKLSFECSGKCEGSCQGSCEIPTCTVDVEPGTFACSGECRGSCAAEIDAQCSGKCEGECSGECSAYVKNAEGEFECAGTCNGTCSGKCEVQAEAECSGECRGECVIVGPEAEVSCEGELKCEGSCTGECSGSCEGEISAPKCEGQASCNAEASAKCEAQASAQASASLECTPPSLDIDYNFKADLTVEQKAEVIAKLDKFRIEMIGIIQGMVELRALVDADYAVEIGVEPASATIAASVADFKSALVSGQIEVEAVGLIPCAIPAFEEAGQVLLTLPGEMEATIQAQLSLFALLEL